MMALCRVAFNLLALATCAAAFAAAPPSGSLFNELRSLGQRPRGPIESPKLKVGDRVELAHDFADVNDAADNQLFTPGEMGVVAEVADHGEKGMWYQVNRWWYLARALKLTEGGLKVGDRVQLVSDFRTIADSADGDLKLGELSEVSEVSHFEDGGVWYNVKGWWYVDRALKPATSRALSVGDFVELTCDYRYVNDAADGKLVLGQAAMISEVADYQDKGMWYKVKDYWYLDRALKQHVDDELPQSKIKVSNTVDVIEYLRDFSDVVKALFNAAAAAWYRVSDWWYTTGAFKLLGTFVLLGFGLGLVAGGRRFAWHQWPRQFLYDQEAYQASWWSPSPSHRQVQRWPP